MKEKKNNRRPIIIILLLFVGVFLVGLTAAAVYASRFVSREVTSLLSQVAPQNIEPLAPSMPEPEENPSIYEQGVLVTGILPSSPAQKAGIRRGTIILEIDGQKVDNLTQLSQALADKGNGATVSMKILNGPKPEIVSVVLADGHPLLGVQIAEANYGGKFGQMPPNFDPSEIPEDFYFDPHDLPFDPGQFGFPEDFEFNQGSRETGVLVAEVVAGSAAESAGLQAGDTIEMLDGQEVTNVEQLIEIIASASPGDTLKLTIVREGEPQEVAVTLGEHPEDTDRGFLGIQPLPMMPSFGHGSGYKNFDPHGEGMLPEEFFRYLHPDAESGEFFELPDSFEWPESLEEFMPDGIPPHNGAHDLSQQDA